MSKGLEGDVRLYHGNPSAGKGGMLIGKVSRVTGYIAGGCGGIGFLTRSIAPNIQGNSGIEKLFRFFEDGYGPLLCIGGGLVLAGIISGAIGKAQHWYTNKNYYEK
jgi:hypothetical protein